MKLLLDENLSPGQAVSLRALGYDALSALDAGLCGQPDGSVRDYAIAEGRVLITLDADSANILRFPTAGTPGVIRLKVHPPLEQAVWEQLERTLARLAGRALAGCLVVSHGTVIRIRTA